MVCMCLRLQDSRMNSIMLLLVCFVSISTFCASPVTQESLRSDGPFLREKRASVSCAVPANWPEIITELNSFLVASTVMALSPQQQKSLPQLPTDQPAVCPGANDTWWPGSTDNLRSTCPWYYRDVDLGESFYPRYLREAECMCPFCVKANALGCQKMHQEVTVFKIGACRDGLALMTTVKKTISVACYCTANSVQFSLANGPTPIQ